MPWGAGTQVENRIAVENNRRVSAGGQPMDPAQRAAFAEKEGGPFVAQLQEVRSQFIGARTCPA